MYITGKKARDFVMRYRIAGHVGLFDVYDHPSYRKVLAWNYCIKLCNSMNGCGLTVLSHNVQTFTAAFEYTHPDTGVLMLHVETYANSYDMEM